MPLFHHESQHGNLIIEFKVIYPKKGEITPKNQELLKNVKFIN